jgi:hypothetical protein
MQKEKMTQIYPWKALRQAWGLSQPSVVARAQVAQSYYSRVERGLTTPGVDIAGRLWDAMAIPKVRDRAQWIVWFREPAASPVSPMDAVALAAIFEAMHASWDLVGRTGLGLPVTSIIDADARSSVVWWVFLSAYARGLGVTPIGEVIATYDPSADESGRRQWYVRCWIDLCTALLPDSAESESPSLVAMLPTPTDTSTMADADPVWRELASLWPRLSEPVRRSLVTLARECSK